MSNHTPAPWRVGGHPGDSSGTGWRVILSDGAVFNPAYVCQAIIDDAHLIAAAPDLLRGCQAALAYLADPPSEFEVNRAAAVEIIREAISKAQGVTHASQSR